MSREINNELREMAKLTVMTNRISEIQAKNLRMFPMIFFEGVQRAEVDYDLTSTSEVETEENLSELDISYRIRQARNSSKIVYRLSVDENAINEQIEKRFAALEAAARRIFWSELKIELYFNGNLIRKST